MTANKIYADRYECLRRIGEGGMAFVYLAFDRKLKRNVAIKVMHEHMREKSDLRVRFRHEAQSVSKLRHPNILEIYDFSGEDTDELWIVTEYIEGYDLSTFAKKHTNKKVNPFIASLIVREISKALNEAHRQGIIHRDIKPSNIMISKTGHVKLMDFGIAKDLGLTDFTHVGTFMGSPSYMSPEQIKGSKIDVRSDLYALSVLFYEIVTGELPFKGTNSHDVITKVLHREATPPSEMDRGIPTFISEFIQKGLDKTLSRRHQASLDMTNLLDEYVRQHGLADSRIELEKLFNNPKAFQRKLEKLGLTRTIYEKKEIDSIKQTVVSDINSSEEAYKKLVDKLRQLSEKPNSNNSGKNLESMKEIERDNGIKPKKIELKISKKSLEVLEANKNNNETSDASKTPSTIDFQRKPISSEKRPIQKKKKSVSPRKRSRKRQSPISIQKSVKPTSSIMDGFKELVSFAIAFVLIGSLIASLFLAYGIMTKKIEIENFTIKFNKSEVNGKKKNDLAINRNSQSKSEAKVPSDQDTNEDSQKTTPKTSADVSRQVKKKVDLLPSRRKDTISIIEIETKDSSARQIEKETRKSVRLPKQKTVHKYSKTNSAKSSTTMVSTQKATKTNDSPKNQIETAKFIARLESGIKVFLNNVYIGTSENIFNSTPYRLKAGKYTFKFFKDGHRPVVKSVQAAAGSTYKLSPIKFIKLELYSLGIEAFKGLSITIADSKGKKIKTFTMRSTSKSLKLEKGRYLIKAKQGSQTFERFVNLPSVYGDVTINIDFNESH